MTPVWSGVAVWWITASRLSAVWRTNTSRVRACVIRSAMRVAEFRYLGFNTAANTSNIWHNTIFSTVLPLTFFHPAECHHEMIVRSTKVLLSF